MDQPNTMQQPLPNGTLVLILGILSIIGGCCCYGVLGIIVAVIALILAKNAKELYEINPDVYTASSFSNVKTGRILAIIGLVLSILMTILSIIMIAKFGLETLMDPEALQEMMEEMQNQ